MIKSHIERRVFIQGISGKIDYEYITVVERNQILVYHKEKVENIGNIQEFKIHPKNFIGCIPKTTQMYITIIK